MEENQKTKHFMKEHYSWALLIVCLVLAFYITTIPADAPQIDKIAKSNIDSYISKLAEAQVMEEYPNVPRETLQTEIGKQIKFLTNSAEYASELKLLTSQLKAQVQDDTGHLYMQDIDSYFFLRYAENILDHGNRGDELRDGREYDLLLYAPEGEFVSADKFHSYFLAYFDKVLEFFNHQPAKYNTFWYPVFVMMLIAIVFFILSKKVTTPLIAFISTMILLVSPGLIMRILYGHADNDSWNVFFPIAVTLFYYLMYESKTLKSSVIWGAIAGLCVGVYASAWMGYWFILYFLLASGVVAFVIQFIRKKEVKNLLWGNASFIISTLLFIALFRGFLAIKNLLLGPISFLNLQTIGGGTIWPNVFTTVAEQNAMSYQAIISMMGGALFLFIACIGIVWAIVGKRNSFLSSFLLLSIVITMIASTKGVRYMIFLCPIFLLAVALGIEFLIDRIPKLFNKHFGSVNELFIKVPMIIIVIFLLFVPTFSASKNAATSDLPNMNDAWYYSLIKIRDESDSSAMITSWWDFGHWFKQIAERRVNFDGTSQNTPKAHWVGKLLLTSDENLSRDIMLMLDCGGNQAYRSLLLNFSEDFSDPQKFKELVYVQDEGTTITEQHLAVDKVYDMLLGREQIPNYLHPLINCTNPPEGYLILSDDMIGKAGVWAHFGSWDFDKAHIVADKNSGVSASQIAKEYNVSEETIRSVYYEINTLDNKGINDWIAPWPSVYPNVGSCGKTNETLICSIVIDGNQLIMQFDKNMNLTTNVDMLPYEYAYESDGGVYYVKGGEKNLGMSFAITPDRTRVYGMDPRLLHSVFVRGYIFEGVDLENFELFSHEASAFSNVYVYKVKW